MNNKSIILRLDLWIQSPIKSSIRMNLNRKIKHGTPRNLTNTEPIQTLLHLFAKRAHVLERYVRHSCLMNQQCLHDTVHRIWSGYRSNGVWSALPAPDERWVVTTTQSEKAYSPMTVHYNILDGSLLVNGLSLTRLPRSYQLHATYRRLFGDVCNPVILVLRGTMLMIST